MTELFPSLRSLQTRCLINIYVDTYSALEGTYTWHATNKHNNPWQDIRYIHWTPPPQRDVISKILVRQNYCFLDSILVYLGQGNDIHLWGTYTARDFHKLYYLIFAITLIARACYCTRFSDEATEGQEGKNKNWPMFYREEKAKLRSEQFLSQSVSHWPHGFLVKASPWGIWRTCFLLFLFWFFLPWNGQFPHFPQNHLVYLLRNSTHSWHVPCSEITILWLQSFWQLRGEGDHLTEVNYWRNSS